MVTPVRVTLLKRCLMACYASPPCEPGVIHSSILIEMHLSGLTCGVCTLRCWCYQYVNAPLHASIGCIVCLRTAYVLYGAMRLNTAQVLNPTVAWVGCPVVLAR